MTAAKIFSLAAKAGLAGTIFLAPFRLHAVLLPRTFPPVWPDYTSLLLYASDLFLVAMLLFWLLDLAAQPRRVYLGPLWLALPLAGLALSAGISSLTSTDPVISLYQTARLALFFGLYLYVVNETRSLRLVFFAAGAQVAFQAVVAVAQVLKQHSLGLTRLQEMQLDPAWQGISIVWSESGRSLRAYGLSDHPNLLGGCLALGLLFIGVGHLSVGERWKVFTGGLFALGSAALLLTFSRSAWLGLGAGLMLIALGLLLARARAGLARLAVLCAAALLVLAPFLWQNAGLLDTRLGGDGSFSAATPENQSINERGILIQRAVRIFASQPLTGVGAGAFPEKVQQVYPDGSLNAQPPHVVLLDIAAETGLPGALSYLLLEILPWLYLQRNFRRIQFSLPLLAILAGILALSVISFFDYYPWLLNPGRIGQWLLWGLLGAFVAQVPPLAHREEPIHV